MVAVVKKIGDGASAVKYFYFTEKNYECTKGWVDTKGAKEFGLNGFSKEDFENMLDGKIVKNEGEGLLQTQETIQLGRKTKEGIEHQAGQEVILSAPKSFSIMCLVAKDKRLEEVQQKAVEKVAHYAEQNMIYTRVQEDGNMKYEKADNIACAYFTHMTSRPAKREDSSVEKVPDPGLHTHLVFANATKRQDGKFRSVVFDKYYDHQLLMGEIYRMELERGSKEAGYQTNLFRDKKSGRWTFEIDGGSTYTELDKDIKEFSTRRSDIEEMAVKEGKFDSKSMAFFAKITRDEKIEFSKEALEENWQKRTSSISKLQDLKQKALSARYLKEGLELDQHMFENDRSLAEGIDYAIRHLSEKEAVWSYESLTEAVIDKVGPKHSIEEITQELNKFIKKGGLIKSYDANLNTLTTKENIIAEKRCVHLMQKLQGNEKPIMSQKDIRAQIRDENLNSGQKDSVILSLNSKDRVVGVQGSAGTGKTTTLNVIKELAEGKGYELLGLAPTRSASATIREEVGIKAETLHKFLSQYDGVIAGRGTAEGRRQMRSDFANKLVILDEASLIGSHKMRDFFDLSDKLKFKVVLLGDKKQLGAVEAGKPFYYLQEYGMNTASLQQIVRQKEGSDLLKSVYLSEQSIDKEQSEVKKNIYEALKRLGDHNIIDVAKIKEESEGGKEGIESGIKSSLSQVNSDDLVEHAYKEWRSFYGSGKDSYVIAPSNYLRDEINLKIRDHFKIGDDYTHLILRRRNLSRAQMEESSHYNAGDLVLFNKDYNDFEKNSYYRVRGEDTRSINAANLSPGSPNPNNLLKLENKKGAILNLDPAILRNQREGMIEIFEEKEIKISEGDKIKWTRNSKVNNFVINGDSAEITNINGKSVSFIDNKGEIRSLNLGSSDMRHIDYNYCHTAYGAQGKTKANVIAIARAKEKFIKLTTQRSFYVSISRAKVQVKLIIDDYKGLINSLSNKSGEKSSAIEHIEEKQVIDLNKNIVSSKREVYIAKKADIGEAINSSSIIPEARESFVPDRESKSKGANNSTAKNATSQKTVKIKDQTKLYQEFLGSRSLIEKTATEYFGEVHPVLSKGRQLRFGSRGAVSVNLDKASYYDFSTGESGSLYSLYKQRVDKSEIPLKEVIDFNSSKLDISLGGEEVINNSKDNTINVSQKELRKIELLTKQVQNSSAIKDLDPKSELGNLTFSYLVGKKKIDLKYISSNLSNDIRITDKAYNSETKSFQPAILALARNNLGELSAIQSVYLNNKTKDSDESLLVGKRNIGSLKGNYVELTNNINSKTIFIAESLETGLSILNAKKDARVIAGLGISNLQNLSGYFSQNNLSRHLPYSDANKKLIIVADNAGAETEAKSIITSAVVTLKEKGFTNVSVIKPVEKGYSFNDLLQKKGLRAVTSHTASVLSKCTDMKNKILSLENDIEKLHEKSSYGDLFSPYKDSRAAERIWIVDGRVHGPNKVAENVRKNLALLGKLKGNEFVGIESTERKLAKAKMLQNIEGLKQVESAIYMAKQKENDLDNLVKDFSRRFSHIAELNTKGLSLQELNDKLERIVTWDLNQTDNRTDYLGVKKVSERIAEKILNYRNTYNKEATSYNKKMYFFESRFELSRESKLRDYLHDYNQAKNIKNNSHAAKNKIIFETNLKRLSHIDSNIAKHKSEVYFKPASRSELMEEYNRGNIKIRELTQEYEAKGHSKTAANYIALSKVSYEEKHDRHMPAKLESYLEKVSEYVNNNYKELKKFGFSNEEALISFNEGDKLFTKYDRSNPNMSIDKSEIKSLQKESKQQIENQQNHVLQDQNIAVENKPLGLGNQGFSM